MSRGIDVASHQGYPDWGALRSSDVNYAYIKASEGTDYVSTHVDGQWNGAAAAGMTRGLYHFARPDQTSPESEAELFARMVNAKGAKGAGFLPPCLDIEVGSGHLGWWVQRFITSLRQFIGGHRVIVYSGGVFYRDKIGDDSLPTDTFAWIAHYNGSPGNSPYLTGRTVMHQYSDSGQVNGIVGNVDLDWATRPLAEITGVPASPVAPGGIESMAFGDKYRDWAGNEQTVQSWMDHIDQRLLELWRSFLEPGSEPSRIPGDTNRTNLRDAIMDSTSWEFQHWQETRANRAAIDALSKLIAESHELDADEVAAKVEAAVTKALKENTVSVDVDVHGNVAQSAS